MTSWGDLYSGQQIVVESNPNGIAADGEINTVPTVTDTSGMPTTEWAPPEGQIVDLEPAGVAILSMLHEGFRPIAETMIRPMMAQIRASVDDRTYAAMSSDFINAAKLFAEGKRADAISIISAYFPKEQFEVMLAPE